MLVHRAKEGDLSAYDELVRQALTEKLGDDAAVADAVKEMGEELGVTVSPRYGTWDGLQIQAESGSISELAKQPQG